LKLRGLHQMIETVRKGERRSFSTLIIRRK